MIGTTSFLRRTVRRLAVAAGSLFLTFLFFLVLPLIQAINKGPEPDTMIEEFDTGFVPPPPPPLEEDEPEPEEEPEEEAPELEEDFEPLDFSQLELMLDPGFGAGGMAGDFTIKLGGLGSGDGEAMEDLFGMSDLDQEPRPISTVQPVMSAKLRKRAPAKVTLIFIVSEDGRVEKPKVQSSSDALFDRPAMNALKKWRFEPGKRNGKAVASPSRITITFPG